LLAVKSLLRCVHCTFYNNLTHRCIALWHASRRHGMLFVLHSDAFMPAQYNDMAFHDVTCHLVRRCVVRDWHGTVAQLQARRFDFLEPAAHGSRARWQGACCGVLCCAAQIWLSYSADLCRSHWSFSRSELASHSDSLLWFVCTYRTFHCRVGLFVTSAVRQTSQMIWR